VTPGPAFALSLALVAASGAAAGTSQARIEATVAACRAAGSAAAALARGVADAAVALYAGGALEVAAACIGPLERAAQDEAAPAADRLAALRALARLSGTDPSNSRADDVAATLERALAGGNVDALAAWQVRLEHAVLLALLRRSSQAEAALQDLLAAAPPAADAADRLRARRYLAVATADGLHAADAPALARAVLLDDERLLGPDHVETLLAALGLGTLLWRVNDLPAAEQQYERAAAGLARTLGASHAYTLSAREGLGLLALRRGRFEPALAVLGAALDDARRTRADDDPDVLNLEYVRANALTETGRLREALAACERLRRLFAARYGDSDDRTLDVHNLLAVTRYWLGDGRGAMRAAEAAIAARARVAEPYDPRRLADEALYASALQLVGRSDEAARRLERALALGRPVHGPAHAAVLLLELELALAYLDDGRAAEAIPLLQSIDRAFAGQPGEQPHVRLMAEQLLAVALLDSGRPQQARTLAEAAWARRSEAFGADSALAASVAVTHARALLALGDAAAARGELQAALRVLAARRDGLWRDRFGARAALAAADDALGDADAARRERQRLVDDVERIRATLDDSPAVRQAYLREWIPQYKQLALDEAAAGRADEAFRIAELARARTLLESLRSRRADESGPADARERAALAALAGRIGVIDEALQSAGDEAKVALEAERSRVADALAAERARIAAHDPRYAALLAVPSATPGDAPRLLQPGDLFVSYTVHQGRLLVLRLDAQARLVARIVPIEGSLRDAIEGWRALLLAPPGQPGSAAVWIDGARVTLGVLRPSAGARRAASAEEVGRLLASWLLGPLADALGGVQRIIVAPDPALALVPFDALPWRGRPLVAALDIAHVQSFGVLGMLVRQARSPSHLDPRPHRTSNAASPARRAPRGLLAVADPAYGNGGADGGRRASEVEAELRLGAAGPRADQPIVWPALAGTRREALAVARLFARRRLLLGAAASEAELRRIAASSEWRRYDVLHFATHGLISAQRPWSSALVLAAPPPQAPEDGYLTALEISRLDLAGRLVVLSACDTATGNALDGEGVLGFPYVLLGAGAAATMLTLWPIDDDATARLMPAVMRGVRAGLAPSRALARAKRGWIAGNVPARAWAGLLVYGP